MSTTVHVVMGARSRDVHFTKEEPVTVGEVLRQASIFQPTQVVLNGQTLNMNQGGEAKIVATSSTLSVTPV